MTTDPDPFEEASAPLERTFRPKPIPIGTALRNIRFGQPAMKELPARPKLTNPTGLELLAALSRSC